MHVRISFLTEMSLFCEWRWQRALPSILFDTFTIGLVSHLACLRRRLPAYISGNVLSLVWMYVNIIYATYFSTYLPLSMIQEAGNLSDLPMHSYIADALSLWDILPLIAAVSLPLALKARRISIWNKSRLDTWLLAFPLAILICYFIGLKLFIHENQVTLPNKATMAQVSLMPAESRLNLNSTLTIYETGIVRGQILPYLFRSADKTLTNYEREEINRYIKSLEDEKAGHSSSHVQDRKNLILIMAETYLAASACERIEGREVTPFLNSLRRESGVTVNDSMANNIGIGGSSSGQFTYMTGLLPLRNRLTISVAQSRKLHALPTILREQGYYTLMTNPCQASLWNQENMCRKYGIDHHYALSDANTTWMNDEQMFCNAIENEAKTTVPFFHLMLTISTHRPYDNETPELRKCSCHPHKRPADISPEYFNYLQKVHYMDHAIEQYISSLKNRGLYDNSVIVIASDHGWQEDSHWLRKSEDADRLSLIIIGADREQEYYKGPINQLDVFTSILDLLDVQSDKTSWKGLGRSIFRPETYRSSVTDKTWDISSDIITGDYFNIR